MGWQVILVGSILGFRMVALQDGFLNRKSHRLRRIRKKPTNRHRNNFLPTPSHGRFPPSHVIRRLTDISRGMGGVPGRWGLYRRRIKRNNFVETWRVSIIGLVRLADRNLKRAEGLLKLREYKNSIKAASTSVENISRALIHCFGGKPDDDMGQQEPLRMLAPRLQGEEKVKFEDAIELVVYIDHNRRALDFLSNEKVQNHILDEFIAKKTSEFAARIVSLFQEIVYDHFVREIPELGEICPRRGSKEISVRASTKNEE